MKVWSGAWAEKPTKVWSGSAWVAKPVKVWSGSAWVTKPAGGGAIVAPVFRSHTLTSYASRNDTIMNIPAGVAANDILIAMLLRGVYSPAAADVVPPAGFTKVGTTTAVQGADTFTGRLELFWKRATGSEPSTYTFGQWANATTQGLMAAYSGCVTSGSPVDVFSQNNANTGSTATGTGVTTTQANDLLLYLGHNWTGNGALTPPTGMTERADAVVYLSDQTIATASATGNRTQTLAESNPWAVYLVALKGI